MVMIIVHFQKPYQCHFVKMWILLQEIAIDITGRDPADHPQGIPYRLVAEACQQAINVNDIGSIFEEHRIVKNLNVWQHSHQVL